jgi:hypothetical protein
MAFSDADLKSAMPAFTEDKNGSDDVRGMAALPSPRAPMLTTRQSLATTH